MADGAIGKAIPRLEDDRFLRGEACYLDDLAPAGTLEAAIVRSPLSHARITDVDLSEAGSAPGTVAVLDGREAAESVADLVFEIAKIIPGPVLEAVDPQVRIHPMPVLAHERVLYAGQPVAVVVAESRYLAEDAAEFVAVDYEPLPAVVDLDSALAADAPVLEPEWPDNMAISFRARKGDAEAAFASASVTVEEEFRSHRYMAVPIETRGVLAAPDPASGGLTVWSSTQTPFLLRDVLTRALGLPPRALRVLAPDVGGGFGLKGSIYPEDVIVPLLALQLGRPVKWVEDRAEHMMASTQGREQVHRIALAADESGRILAVRDTFLVNLGAYNTLGLVVPYNSFTHLLGPYDIEHLEVDARGVITNTAITAPYRGAGRPEAVFAMERAIDRLARKIGLDPADVRERNLIPAGAMPYETGLVYRDGAPQVYDSGDYPELFRRARGLVEENRWRAEQARGAHDGTYLGLGYAAYVEGTGVGPFETAAVTLEPSGRIRVETGGGSQGQGHRTTLAQLAADVLGVGVNDVDVIGGDTATLPHGFGTIASRTVVVAGMALTQAAERLRERLLRLAADELEIAPDDLEIADGRVQPRGDPATGLSLGELAGLLVPYNPRRPPDQAAELRETAVYRPPTVTYAAAANAAVVRVDARTGVVELVRYAVVHDCGRVVNPLVADGQIVGGVVQGIGGALYEELVYDEGGMLRNGSLMDYLLPTVSEVPEIRLDHVEFLSPLNPLGVKGLGEGGAIGPPAAIANAVEDALHPLGVVVREGPLSPPRVLALISEARDPADPGTDAPRPIAPASGN